MRITIEQLRPGDTVTVTDRKGREVTRTVGKIEELARSRMVFTDKGAYFAELKFADSIKLISRHNN